MFGRGKLMRGGVAAQALVLDKKVYASGVETGRADACRYRLRVRFDDGSTTEISRRVWSHRLAYALVGDLIPVRYDRADRSRIIIDGPAVKAKRAAQLRELKDQAIKLGERDLDQS
jgi:hypothetical protein